MNAFEQSQFLEGLLNRAITFVRFAEAKNASIVVASAAFLLPVIKDFLLLAENQIVKGMFVIAAFLFFVALIGSAWSYFPLGRSQKLSSLGIRNFDTDTVNVLYSRHQGALSVDQFLEAYESAIGTVAEPSKVTRLYADQIIQNGHIFEKKLGTFRRSLVCFVIAVLVTSAGMLLSISLSA